MGFQESPPRPEPKKQGLAPAWWIALPLIGLGLWVWVDKRLETGSEQVGEPVQAVEPQGALAESDDADQAVHLREMLSRAERRLADQREEIGNLERQLADAETESDRNRQGLERAVEELNRINEELNRLEAAAMIQQSWSPPEASTPQVGPLGASHVTTHQFGYVVASGMVHNPTDYPARGTLEVSIAGSAGVIDTRGFGMTIAPGRTERYDITFTNVFPTERLGAQARWVP